MTDLTPIYRIAGLGILVAVLNIFLVQADRKEQAQMLSLAGVIIVLLWLVRWLHSSSKTWKRYSAGRG